MSRSRRIKLIRSQETEKLSISNKVPKYWVTENPNLCDEKHTNSDQSKVLTDRNCVCSAAGQKNKQSGGWNVSIRLCGSVWQTACVADRHFSANVSCQLQPVFTRGVCALCAAASSAPKDAVITLFCSKLLLPDEGSYSTFSSNYCNIVL